MLLNDISIPIEKGGHNLISLLDKIKTSNRVNDPYLISDDFYSHCKNIEPFATAGRYPEEKVSAWGWSGYELIQFIDKFVFNMRALVRDNFGTKIFDPIENAAFSDKFRHLPDVFLRNKINPDNRETNDQESWQLNHLADGIHVFWPKSIA